ncbi:hypothetical protein [Spirosoma areae]
MKTLRNALFALVALSIFASCSKKEADIAPANAVPPAAELAGDYVVTQYRYNNESPQNLPAGRRIQISFGYIADSQATMLFNESNSGQSDTVDDYGNFELKRVGRAIEVYNGSEKIGSYANGVVEVGLDHPKGILRFTAKRK